MTIEIPLPDDPGRLLIPGGTAAVLGLVWLLSLVARKAPKVWEGVVSAVTRSVVSGPMMAGVLIVTACGWSHIPEWFAACQMEEPIYNGMPGSYSQYQTAVRDYNNRYWGPMGASVGLAATTIIGTLRLRHVWFVAKS